MVFQIDLDDVINCFRSSIKRAANEEEVRIGASRCIEEKILAPLGITQDRRYEYTLISGGRVDALYGHVVVEYKAPGKLSPMLDKAKEQIVRYITGIAKSKNEWNRYFGVIVSDKIAFVKYDMRRDEWIVRGPYDIEKKEVIVKFIEALRGLRRKALRVDTILKDFGPQSEVARRAIRTLHSKLAGSKNPRTRALFEDWIRLFKQTTGYDPSGFKELHDLISEYGLLKKVDADALMFSIQTYYAFLMKLLAAEVMYIYGSGNFYKSYIAELDDAYTRGGASALKENLKRLESGGIFRQLGYENFLEGDYFSWYLDELDEELAKVLVEIVKKLGEYEPATPQLEPEFARDLLKRLYQHLVPREVRHGLGEYYTPDWLADLLLDEVGLSQGDLENVGKEDSLKPLQIRVLDPACGSGTFLVRYIARLREYAEEHYLRDELVGHLLKNVVGFDLNPLAVLAARTNYLLMIADLPKPGRVEIPVYLADSLMVERRTTLIGNVYVLRTVVGEFQLPASLVEESGQADLLSRILSELENALELGYEVESFKSRLRNVFRNLSNSEIDVLAGLYDKLLKLEKEGRNGVWVSIIRNAFAPMLKGRFDYVVGNPPWVRWESLPEEYRNLSKSLWERYGIVGAGAGFKRDLSMLFLARCFDLYLKPGGRLAFLMPLTVLKTEAGAGFRKFLATKARILVVHDLVSLNPFEGATNSASAVVVEKVCELGDTTNFSKCPELSTVIGENEAVKNVVWVNRTGRAIPTDARLDEVRERVSTYKAVMTPVEEKDPSTPWMQVVGELLPYIRRVTTGESYYAAHEGVLTALNQVYYLQIKGTLPDGRLLVTNPPEPSQKRAVEEVEEAVESDLVYPLVRGRDVKRWYVEYRNRYIIIPHVPGTGDPIPEGTFKTKYPGAYGYLYRFKNELMKRSIKPFLSLREKMSESERPAERDLARRRLEESFYILDNIGSYTFKPYKVVWRHITRAATGKPTTFGCAVLEPRDGRLTIPNDKLMAIAFDDLAEAHYVAGVLNSSIARLVVATYCVGTEVSTHVVKYVKIPKYDPGNPLHQGISEFSRKAHELAMCIYAPVKPRYCGNIKDPEKELENVEIELDKAVAKLYGIPEEALESFWKGLDVLTGKEVMEGSEE